MQLTPITLAFILFSSKRDRLPLGGEGEREGELLSFPEQKRLKGIS